MDEGRQFRVHPGHHRLEAHGRPRVWALWWPFHTSLTFFNPLYIATMDIVDHTLALLIPSVGLCLAV